MLHGYLIILFLAFSSLYAGNPPPKSVPIETDYDDEEDEDDEDVLLLEEDVDEEYEPHN